VTPAMGARPPLRVLARRVRAQMRATRAREAAAQPPRPRPDADGAPARAKPSG
jgi:hypothetical protein